MNQLKHLRQRLFSGATLIAVLAGCGPQSPSPESVAVSLIDRFEPGKVSGTRPSVSPTRMEWRFDHPVPAATPLAETHGWEAGSEVADLKVEGGVLAGRSTGPFPILHLAKAFPDRHYQVNLDSASCSN